MIKQSLNIKLGQSLTMTPQLQQAIRLLQLSTLDLQQEIQQVIESNPLLEQDEAMTENNLSEDKSDQETPEPSSLEEIINSELSSDSQWDDTYDLSSSDAQIESGNANLLETLNAATVDLKEHLLWQVNMDNLSIQDRIIANSIIDGLDQRGYLLEPIEEIHSNLNEQLIVDLDEIENIVVYIQHLDPIGSASRNLQECLLVQLSILHSDHVLYRKSCQLLEKRLDLLTKGDYKGLKKVHHLEDNEYEQIIDLIRSLNPNPGLAFEDSSVNYITPDVYVSKTETGQWIATLNQDTEQTLKINDYYANMIPTTNNTTDKQYLKERLQNAKWFIKALQNRSTTIINVANEIIHRQAGFLKYGNQAMQPMILKDIAGALELHESTISRVCTQKFMHTPHGIYELKHFFSSHIETNTGGECSSTAIRAMIKQLINKENTQKPLSDNKLTTILKQQGINVARRTVAKYREGMAIPSSRERRSLV
ncbi:MAG: RNA polymerase factor sigma-54 [Thiotrichaceae bacterium]|nr:RNA polymerase factor sigma-54 [Thiotrichaceae bacterium]